MSAQRKHAGDQQLRRLGRERREPLHEQELVDPQLAPALDQGVRERPRSREHDPGGDQHQRDHRRAPQGAAKVADLLRHAHQLRLLLASLAGAPEVHAEDGQQHDRVVPGEPARERDHQRIEAGHSEKAQIHPPRLPQDDAALAPPAPAGAKDEEQHHERPPKPQQQPVAARHVRRRVVRVLGDVPGAPGEEQVHRVLREHRDHREDGGGQAAGDVVLRRFGRPNQQERRGHHGRAEDHDRRNGGKLDAEEPQEQAGEAHREGEDDLQHPRLQTAWARGVNRGIRVGASSTSSGPPCGAP